MPSTVKEAQDGDHIQPGTVLIAPGNYHMLVVTVQDIIQK